jgi:hypothetical protein
MTPPSSKNGAADIKLSPTLGSLVDDALAKLDALGPIEAMKWLAGAVHDAAVVPQVDVSQIALPDGYAAVLIADPARPTPDYDECARQADLATDVRGPDQGWLSVFVREINRWCTHRQAETNEALRATAKHVFRLKLGENAIHSSRCALCDVWEGGADSAKPCSGVSLRIRTSRATERRLCTEYPAPVILNDLTAKSTASSQI